MDKTHLTAISRRNDPLPTRWLEKKGLIRGKVLDYGCGKCYIINPMAWDSYDPNFPTGGIYPPYDTIICNYVLCVLPRAKRMPVLKEIHAALKSDGKAYISVRNDRPNQGWGKNKRGTYQGRVHTLKLPLLYECAGFRTYLLTVDTELV
jgi:2-polyprenyl-3-methyl-5-hydroxy-6-metoxy-1,4-benzoquinol methylase